LKACSEPVEEESLTKKVLRNFKVFNRQTSTVAQCDEKILNIMSG